jgi:DNA-binding NarL/FixJ family response regulator
MPIKIALVDDHELFREGVKELLKRYKDFTVCGAFENGQKFIDAIEKELPDIVLMDDKMPHMDGITASKIALQKYPSLKIIGLSIDFNIYTYLEMISSGVKGYLLKSVSKDELEAAIKTVVNGNTYFQQESVYSAIAQMHQEQTMYHKLENFSRREIVLMELIFKGLSNKEISEKLCLSIKTVESNKTKLFQKLGVKSSMKLIANSRSLENPFNSTK